LHGVFQIVHAHLALETRHLRFEMLHVTKFRGTVDDHVDVIAGIGNDGIVKNATLVVCDQTQTTVAWGETSNVSDDQSFQKLDAILAVPTNLEKMIMLHSILVESWIENKRDIHREYNRRSH
jgi:hypothetical protein